MGLQDQRLNSPTWLSAGWRAREASTAQSEKLEASEQGGTHDAVPV
jgi:hypothetical protein